ncbi:DUF1800 domain-containing protein [Curvibacter sp. HBC61]|uniref:DUF1800 domain-containing protein n=1 Tax=Curvibacter cyanobacteriorum TaxID=3026422 RepID=A0ABT5N3U3_9BURK|nr:DUF1800 domain-containing protein [Curvibacter sp. HBC61]MDD0839738.1 DUF1800 domain-containing protein [Curvibacter sp. HBC61]
MNPTILNHDLPLAAPHPEPPGGALEPTTDRWRPAWLSAAAPLGVVACGGGGGGPSSGGDTGTPAPVVVPSNRPTAAEAGRFLSQATLGYSRADLNALMASSYSEWLDAQFKAPRSQGHVDWLKARGYADASYINSTAGLDNTLWRKFISSTDPLRQRMVLALSELCVVSVLGINAQWRQFSVANYLDLLETHAFGNYRTLLQQITLSPAMGYYLTYRGNQKANPNTGSQPDENYARELMQLFTIGLVQLNADGSVKTHSSGAPLETYQQADVSGLARVFTGWNQDVSGLTTPYPPDVQVRPMVNTASRYETGSKAFLGTTIAAGVSATEALNTALDTLFLHPNLPPFVGRQLIQRLVTSNPSPAYVARVSAVFSNNGAGVRGDLQAVLRAILLDTEARDSARMAQPSQGKLREPVVRFLNWARAFGANSPSGLWAVGDTSDPATRLGQSPMRSGSVFNFFRPGYVPPGTALTSQGLTGPEFQITNESSVAGYLNWMQRVVAGSGAGDLSADYSSLLPLAGNAGDLLQEINQVLAASQLSAATLASLQSALNTMPSATPAQLRNRVHAALVLVLAAPEYIVQK